MVIASMTATRWFAGLGRPVSAGLTALFLAACGGDGDSPPPPPTVVTAMADALTLNAAQSGSLLTNDLLGTTPATAGAGGNVVFSLTSGALPAGVAVAEGLVSVSAAAVPAVVALSYRICESASPGNCANGSAQITIPAPPIVAVNDSFNLAASGSGDVLANDTLGGTAATAARVLVNASVALPAGVTLSAAGLLSVGDSATPGTYAVGYRICQTIAPSNCANATANLTVPALGMLTGRVVNATNATALAGVVVAAGGRSTTTDAAGAFSLSGLAVSPRLSVVFSISTHAETVRVVGIDAGRSTDVQARLLPVGSSVSLPVDTGGTATVPGSPARLVLGANALQRADGSLPTGNVSVRLTPISPAVDSSLMPGDFTTLASGVVTPIESFGALAVDVRDSSGVALSLRAGQTVALRVPVASRSAVAPGSIPLFFFDNASGRWVQEGTATLIVVAGSRAFEGSITRLGTWNADRVFDTVRVSGCVADALGVRQPGALVTSDGVDYSGTSRAVADSTGNFSIALRRDSAATLTARAGANLSNTVRVNTGSSDSSLGACLAFGQAGGGVTMKLTWGFSPSDLDSYLFTPSGTRINYTSQGSLVAAPFANLDVDDTSSYGPEVVTVTRLMVGTYKYAVNNYSGQGSGLFSLSEARVELSIPGRVVELFVPPALGETNATNWWWLFEFDVDATCNITLRRAGSFNAGQPTAAPFATPVYCTRP